MKLKTFIKKTLEAFEPLNVNIEYDIGVEPNMNVQSWSQNRIRFIVNKESVK